jgi:hypothetical protein
VKKVSKSKAHAKKAATKKPTEIHRAKLGQINEENNAERDEILEKRKALRREFPAKYSPEVGVFRDDKFEVMFRLTHSQAESLARLLKENSL